MRSSSPLFVAAIVCAYWVSVGLTAVQAQTRIVGDVAVSQMVEKHIELNARVKTIPGYRVQIASLSGANAKTNSFALKERFETAFPEVQAYIVYDEPNFKVKVGDFRTRLEAYAFQQNIKEQFKGYIVKDNINPEPPETIEFAPDDETSGDEE